MRLPYIKWFYRDAAADLRLLDSSPRCVWYEMLWIMAASDRYGYLERQGRPMTDEEISRSCGIPAAEIEAARPILLADNIPSIEPETGIWFCRRMVDDEQRRMTLSEAGKRGGGSPLLASSPLATELVSEARTQNPYKRKGTFKGTFKGEDKGGDKEPVKPFDSAAFEAAWMDYLAYRRERRLPSLQARSIAAKFAEMKTWGEAAAIEAIRKTIANGWTGIFHDQVGASKPAAVDQSRIARGRTAADYAAVTIRGDGK